MPLLKRLRHTAGVRRVLPSAGAQQRASRRPGGAPNFGSTELGEQLEDFAARRGQFLSCSGMHTPEVRSVVKTICEGNLKGPGAAYVAPALYEGVAEFLGKTMDAQGELAVYASLYLSLVAAVGMSGFLPTLSHRRAVESYYNGVYSSMFCFSGVVLVAVLYRFAAVGHMRESDMLLYLWRARYAPLLCCILFILGVFGAIFALMYSITDTVVNGGACFASKGDPTMHWWDWWDEWVGVDRNGYPVHVLGAGTMHPKGVPVLNPWMQKANELNYTAPIHHARYFADVGYHQDLKEGYNEFVREHFGFSKTCMPQQALHERFGGYMSGMPLIQQIFIPYLIIGLALPFAWAFLWLSPTRHIFNYWLAQASARAISPHFSRTFRSALVRTRSPRPVDARPASSASSLSTSSARSRITRSTIRST